MKGAVPIELELAEASERWRKLKKAFLGALELPPAARLAFLDEYCGEDVQLRSETLALLQEDRQEDLLLDDPIADRLLGFLPPEPMVPLAGELLGAYRVLRLVGRGGQGQVYLGERDDGQFQQQVAIKVLDRQQESSAGLLEGQILATLSHPGIARLLDAGTTLECRPYFVMEWIEGQPIDRYSHLHNLGVEKRIRLFLDVCAAVQHAHESLVIHSDLKPGNILISSAGEAKLLDFGVARLQQQALYAAEGTSDELFLTPAYASPEQHRGEHLTAASDVYSLGVVLYQMLTGVLPGAEDSLVSEGSTGGLEAHGLLENKGFMVGKGSTSLPSEAIQRSAELPWSRSASPRELRRWRRRLLGDLDSIALEALAPEPGDRYGSVAALAADLERCLQRRPVTARSPSWVYRGSRWMLRQRFAALAMGIALGALGVLGVQHLEWRKTQELLVEERAKAREMSLFLDRLVSMGESAASPGDDLTVKQVLDQASRSVVVGLADQPAAQASMLATLGRSYQALGNLPRSEESLESALRIQRSHFGARHESVADSLSQLARLRLQQGDVARAEELLRECLEMRRGLLGDVHLKVAEALNDLGETAQAAGRLLEAETWLQEAFSMRQQLVGLEHRAILESFFELAFLQREKGDFREAISYYQRALPLARKLLGKGHLETVLLVNDYGYSLRELGESRAAEGLFREAVSGFEALLGRDHPWVLVSQSNLARLLADEGQFEEAEQRLTMVLEARRRSLPPGDLAIAFGLRDFGQLRLQEGRVEEAETLLRESVMMTRVELPAEDWRISQVESAWGESLMRLGRFEEAEPLLLQSLGALERQWGVEARRSLRARERVAAFYESSGLPDPLLAPQSVSALAVPSHRLRREAR